MDGRAQKLGRRVAELRAKLGRGVSVGISGVDCAGKSTLAAALAELLDARGIPVALVPGDEFTRPRPERFADPDEGLSYYRDSFDYTAVFERILPAVRGGSGGEIPLRISDWENDGWRHRTLSIAPDAVVIVEGCFLFAGGGAREFDLSVWIDLPLEEIVPRALARPRDLDRMGGPAGVRERYGARYVPGQRLHLERDRPQEQATLVLLG